MLVDDGEDVFIIYCFLFLLIDYSFMLFCFGGLEEGGREFNE